ncbi:MAG: DNA mismatch repair endonuclease MutL [Chitinophagaceae bacterium]
MPDIINLLPDNIANQIAAGEVIQRPASAVKELLENAIDAGATQIKMFITDAGKALIQVIDNGKGMSETDARMAFERHATSKIQKIEDLFSIKTMGFRGEALASIAAVAQVELKTKRAEDTVGTFIEIENSKVTNQEPCATANGTSISMKNLFFNVPARRNFLKSNTVEMRHIIDEFVRVSMAFPQIFFSLTSNGQDIFHLEIGSIKQRIVQILGNNYNAKLVQVQEQTDYLNITGFVGKPETAKKTRGDQYFFVNNRFIKSAYLNHAVNSAFGDMIAKDSFPSYVLFIDLEPQQIDINVHPTKQEIKFEDEKLIYAFVQSAVKHALAQFSIAPSLDFTLNPRIQQLEAVTQPLQETQRETTTASSLYKTFTQKNQAHFIEPNEKSELSAWKSFFTKNQDDLSQENRVASQKSLQQQIVSPQIQSTSYKAVIQIHQTYIIATNDSDFIIIHQQLAHERVLYEKYSKAVHLQQASTQKMLFPTTIELSNADGILMMDLLPEFNKLGYEIEHFGNNSFVLQGIPADVLHGDDKHHIDLLLEQFKHFSSDIKFSKREKLIRCLAKQHAIKEGIALSNSEIVHLVNDLFACDAPNISASGNPTFLEFKEAYLDRMFGR